MYEGLTVPQLATLCRALESQAEFARNMSEASLTGRHFWLQEKKRALVLLVGARSAKNKRLAEVARGERLADYV